MRLDIRGREANAMHRFGEAVIADAQPLPSIHDLVILGQADQLGLLPPGSLLRLHGQIKFTYKGKVEIGRVDGIGR